jgi:hypothetical protein
MGMYHKARPHNTVISAPAAGLKNAHSVRVLIFTSHLLPFTLGITLAGSTLLCRQDCRQSAPVPRMFNGIISAKEMSSTYSASIRIVWVTGTMATLMAATSGKRSRSVFSTVASMSDLPGGPWKCVLICFVS